MDPIARLFVDVGGVLRGVSPSWPSDLSAALKANSETNTALADSAGENLGHIEHVMIVTPSGRVVAVLDIDRETHENAPGFSKDRWPKMADAAFAAAIQRH